MRLDANPVRAAPNAGLAAAAAAPRCHARSKRTGLPCRGAAVAGWRVCRVHGAGGGHPAGPANPAWRHGLRSRAHVEMRKLANQLARETRDLAAFLHAPSSDFPKGP